MSFTRKTHDGDLSGGSFGTSERRNSFDYKGKIDRFATPKRSSKSLKYVTEEEHFSEDSEKDRYLITYADLITLLLGLFIILYSISTVDSKKYNKVINDFNEALGIHSEGNTFVAPIVNKIHKRPLKDELEEVIKENNYQSSVRLEENERGIVIHILGDILFPSGSSDLNENSLKILDKLAAIIKVLPNDIRVEGHTDDVPITSSMYPSNWHLSVGRALNTAYYLINKQMLSPDKVSIVGYSEYKPIAENNSQENRTLNRRVDIVIIKK